MPIFSARLVDESGERITGGCATAGIAAATNASRSCTSCRARIRSVPSRKISTTDDRPSTDFERIVLSHGSAVERVLERHGDQAFDFFGRKTRGFGLNLDQRRRELRENIERRVAHDAHTDDQQQNGERQDNDAQF